MADASYAPGFSSPASVPISDPPALPFLHTLGQFVLTDGEHGALLMQRGKPLALLAYCMADRRRRHHRDALALLLWADTPQERARHNVRQALWRVRRVVGDRIQTGDEAVSGISPELLSDRDLFLEAESRGDLEAMFRHYRGPFLSGISLSGGDEFEEWAERERRALENTLVRVTEQAIAAAPERYGANQLRQFAAGLVERAPDSAEARRIALDLLLNAGDTPAARREAVELESISAAQHVPLSPGTKNSIERARASVAVRDDTLDPPASISLKLVGRESLLTLAAKEWQRARDGEFRVLVFEGAAGIGKSRLLQSIAQQFNRRHGQAVMIGANAGEQTVPFSFVASLAQALATLSGAAGVSTASARELVSLNPGLANQFHVEDTPGKAGADDGVRRRAFAMLDLIQAVAEQAPLALCIDDGHWVDDASRQALALIFARLTNLPLLLVVGTRFGQRRLVLDRAVAHSLAPLSPEELADAIRGSGTWPESPAADEFVRRIANDSDGIPLTVIERLSLAVESGLVRRHAGTWSSDDWNAATRRVLLDAPMAHRLSSCTGDELALLQVLTAAGAPLSGAMLVPGLASAATLNDLEAKGFVRCDGGQWSLTHDLVAESVVSLDDGAARRVAHHRLAEVLQRHADIERIARAVWHWQCAGEAERAGHAFTHVVRRFRAKRDPRNARQLLDDVVGPIPEDIAVQIVARVPWFVRDATLKLRWAVVLSTLLALLSGVFAWRLGTTPSLAFEQAPVASIEARLFGDSVVRLVPSPVVRIDSDTASTSPRRLVIVRPEDTTTRIIAGDSILTESGTARFGGLRLSTRGSTVRLRFESEGARPLTTTVRVSKYGVSKENDGSLQLLDGRFTIDGRAVRIRSDTATMHAPAGATIEGLLQIAYSAPWAAASVWVAFTPTWGDPRTNGVDVQPMTTPVQWDVMDLRIRSAAPRQPGAYWLLVVSGAEPSGGYLLSSTNWSSGAPVWGDGNDIATLPDSIIARSRRRGLLPVRVAYPEGSQPECERGTAGRWRYCAATRGLVAIRVIVR